MCDFIAAHWDEQQERRCCPDETRAYLTQIIRMDTEEIIGVIRPERWAVTSNALYHAWWDQLTPWQRAVQRARGWFITLPEQLRHQWWRCLRRY